MGQQCQAETFHGFIPCSLQTKHCYWPGLLLVLHFVLLLVFAFNHQQDPSINLLANLVGTGSLQVWILVSGDVYNNWCLDALEASFTLNLIILVGTTYHVNYSGENQLVVGYTSAIIACGIHCNYCLPDLSTIEAHQAVDEGA